MGLFGGGRVSESPDEEWSSKQRWWGGGWQRSGDLSTGKFALNMRTIKMMVRSRA